MQIEIIARVFTMGGGKRWFECLSVKLKNPYLFPIRNAGRLSKSTINVILLA
jgi:hypothetical protein